MCLIYFLSFLDDAPQFTIKTIAGTGSSGNSGNGGAAINAQLSSVGGVVVLNNGNLIFADTYNNAIRSINKQTGIITIIAGMVDGTPGSSEDGLQATSASLSYPGGVSLDTMNNNLYIADTGNHKIRLVTFSTGSTGIITTFAGTGMSGFSGDGSSAINAQLFGPNDVAADVYGNVYIADTQNNRIRKVNSQGIISTFVGGGGMYSPTHPSGVAADNHGNIFISDTYNGRILFVNSTGFITTFAGGGSCYNDCNGILAVSAHLNSPNGVTVDASGNLYIADTGNNVVRRVDRSTGIITTFAGVGGAGGMMGSLGDGGPATSAYLTGPKSVAIDMSNGVVYISDSGDYRIREVISTYNFPTSQPSEQPTENPTSHASVRPSTPTSQPTEQPSNEPSVYVWQPRQGVSLFVVLPALTLPPTAYL